MGGVALGALVAHCVLILLVALRAGRVASAHLAAAGAHHAVGALAGAAVMAISAWLLLAGAGIVGLAFWFRVQRIRF